MKEVRWLQNADIVYIRCMLSWYHLCFSHAFAGVLCSLMIMIIVLITINADMHQLK